MNTYNVTCLTFKATVSLNVQAENEADAKKEFIKTCNSGKILLPMFPDNYIKVLKIK